MKMLSTAILFVSISVPAAEPDATVSSLIYGFHKVMRQDPERYPANAREHFEMAMRQLKRSSEDTLEFRDSVPATRVTILNRFIRNLVEQRDGVYPRRVSPELLKLVLD